MNMPMAQHIPMNNAWVNRQCRRALLLFTALLLMACDQQPSVSSSSTGLMPARQFDPAQVARGEQVYRQHCSTCHGADAQGDPAWRKRKANGFFPPPPLNGSGHAWHHPRTMLHDMIANGSKPGEGEMPAWKDKLTSEDIEAVITWFQSRWPEPVYAAWYEMQQR